MIFLRGASLVVCGVFLTFVSSIIGDQSMIPIWLAFVLIGFVLIIWDFMKSQTT